MGWIYGLDGWMPRAAGSRRRRLLVLLSIFLCILLRFGITQHSTVGPGSAYRLLAVAVHKISIIGEQEDFRGRIW